MRTETVNCGCCKVWCESIGRYLPKILPAKAIYGSSAPVFFNAEWNPTSQQWENHNGDLLLCSNLYLRDVILQCTGVAGEFYSEATTFTTGQFLWFPFQVALFDDNPLNFGADFDIEGVGIVDDPPNCPEHSTLSITWKEDGF